MTSAWGPDEHCEKCGKVLFSFKEMDAKCCDKCAAQTKVEAQP